VLASTLKDVIGITNIDIEQDMETAMKYNVRSVPTLVFLRDGKEVHRLSGAMPLQQYIDVITEINDSKELNN
jgi:predicted DsbA family dithiol-disulfide isomerase